MRPNSSTAPTISRDLAWGDVVVVRPSSGAWEPRRYVPLVTQYFEEGHSRCLIGTRGLLGEGWDAASVNVFIDLTGAATSTSVHQMRGRSLRLDPALPRKVANNWDVVCIAPDHPKGAADYARFVRKHQSYYALTTDGEVESGVSHVDARLSPYGPPPADDFPTINASLLAQVSRRDAVYDLWGVGKPYENRATQTVRIHFGRSIGIPAQRLARVEREGARDGATTVPCPVGRRRWIRADCRSRCQHDRVGSRWRRSWNGARSRRRRLGQRNGKRLSPQIRSLPMRSRISAPPWRKGCATPA